MTVGLVFGLFASVALRADTTIVLGKVERDLTGDGRSEVLTIIGTGKTIDSLGVTLTITSDGKTVYRLELMPITRRIGFDGVAEFRTAAAQRKFVGDFGGWILNRRNFRSPSEFVTEWRDQSPGRIREIPEYIARDGGFLSDTARATKLWTEIQRTNVTIFEFSAGGDSVIALAWSASDRRFYRVMECC
jgi:hypothetical protein